MRTLQLFPTLLISGIVVVDAEKINPREYRITWVEQGRGFELKLVDGWLIRGHHVRTATIEQARNRVRKIRSEGAKKVRLGRLEQKNLTKIWVGYDDSIQSGNCQSATKNFQARLCDIFGNGEIGGLRADKLIELRDDIFTRRAIAAAAARY